MTKFIPFTLERMMSKYEHLVEFNLSESGVNPLSIQELVEDANLIEDLLSTSLSYPQANGIHELRENISSLYPGALPENILVTTGAAQANFISIWALMEPGDEIAVMLPNYLQIWGLAQNLGLRIRTFRLKEKLGWSCDIEELKQAVTNNTRLIAVCNPNNPTGHILRAEERDAIIDVADRVGAWLLADEVYAGSERTTDEVTATFWGRYDRVLSIGSMSKAYALPGLRIGWAVAPTETIEQLWARQDYTTIASTMLGNKLAAHALAPAVRTRIMARTRDHVRNGYREFESWAENFEGLLTWVPPQATAITFVRYAFDANSTQVSERLVRDFSTYVVPGDHFGLDGFLRIGFGTPKAYLRKGLTRVGKGMAGMR